MSLRKSLAISASVLAFAMNGIAQASNLVADGSFNSTTNGANQFLAAGYGNYGTTSLTYWTFDAAHHGHGNGVAAVYGGGAAAGAIGAPQVGPNHSDTIYLWSTNNPTGPHGTYPVGPDTVTSSPDGGNFVALDSYFTSAITSARDISQVVSGLQIGEEYKLTFWYAGAQFRNGGGTAFNGGFTTGLKVQLGSDTHYTGSKLNGDLSVSSHGFTGWTQASMYFTASAIKETLSFLAVSNNAGLPPVTLLDGVDLEHYTPPGPGPNVIVPEPSSFALTALGLLGLGALRLRRRSKSVA